MKQWLVEQGVSKKSFYYWQRKFRQKGRLRIELNGSISDELLIRILETFSHA